MRLFKLLGAVGLWLLAQPAMALSFNFNNVGGTVSGQFLTGFQTAANHWSALFADVVTVNIDIKMDSLPAGVLGQASPSIGWVDYSTIRTALATDISSVFDAAAVASLQPGNSFAFMLNRTADNPHGPGSATPYLDNNASTNNSRVSMTSANAKAVGLLAGNAPATDAAITLNADIPWDFNAIDGIIAGAFDFVAVVIHEIGHALGFMSTVDILDANSPPHGGPFSGDFFAEQGFGVAVMDLFRYSELSCNNGQVPDWSADARDKFFSFDRCDSFLAPMSEGRNFGDGRQASHWQDHLGLGIMDPTLAPGETGQITLLDVLALDVVGWDVRTVPTLSALPLLLIGMGAQVAVGRARRAAARR